MKDLIEREAVYQAIETCKSETGVITEDALLAYLAVVPGEKKQKKLVRCRDCDFYNEETELEPAQCDIWEIGGEKASPPLDGFCHCGNGDWFNDEEDENHDD